MSTLQLSHLKTSSFNKIAIVEDCVEIDPKNPQAVENAISNILTEMEDLKEALFFKKEKLGRNIDSVEEDKQKKMLENIQQKLRNVKLDPLGDSKNILEKNKTILELKNIQKILIYSIELNENPENMLNTLLHSDVPEDWVFMCSLIFYSLKYNKVVDHEILLTYEKHIEEKLKAIFRDKLESRDVSILKICVEALSQIGKQNLIYEVYVYSFDLMKNPLNVYPPNVNSVDISSFTLTDNSFANLIKTIVAINDEHFELEYQIFSDRSTYKEYLFNNIFRVLISKGVELFLGIRDPNLFLLCLNDAYTQVELFIDNMLSKINISKTNMNSYKSEAFSHFLYKAIDCEKEGFDQMFNALVNGEPLQKKYFLVGSIVIPQKKMLRAFELLLAVIDVMEKRAEKMYSEEDEKEILKYCFQKMNILIDKLILEASDKIHLINELSRIYILTKRYMGDKFYIVDAFKTKLALSLQEAFDFKINYINLTIKKKINGLFFEEKTDYKKLLIFIKASIKEGELLNGRNFNIYTDRILAYTFKRLHKQILSILYSHVQAENLIHTIDEIQGFVLFINRTAMAHHYNYLRNICKLIAVPQDLFLEMYTELENVIADRDIKALIKCREDRDEIQTLIFKNTK